MIDTARHEEIREEVSRRLAGNHRRMVGTPTCEWVVVPASLQFKCEHDLFLSVTTLFMISGAQRN